jgi:hypothetical protein
MGAEQVIRAGSSTENGTSLSAHGAQVAPSRHPLRWASVYSVLIIVVYH